MFGQSVEHYHKRSHVLETCVRELSHMHELQSHDHTSYRSLKGAHYLRVSRRACAPAQYLSPILPSTRATPVLLAANSGHSCQPTACKALGAGRTSIGDPMMGRQRIFLALRPLHRNSSSTKFRAMLCSCISACFCLCLTFYRSSSQIHPYQPFNPSPYSLSISIIMCRFVWNADLLPIEERASSAAC